MEKWQRRNKVFTVFSCRASGKSRFHFLTFKTHFITSSLSCKTGLAVIGALLNIFPGKKIKTPKTLHLYNMGSDATDLASDERMPKHCNSGQDYCNHDQPLKALPEESAYAPVTKVTVTKINHWKYLPKKVLMHR